jgi:hypothetical protein
MADPIDPARFIIHPDGRIEDTQAPGPQPWKRPVRPEVPHRPGFFELTAERKKLLWAGVTAVAIIAGVVAGFLNDSREEPDTPEPTAARNPLSGNTAEGRAFRQLGDQFQASVVLSDTDTHLSKIESAVEKLRALADHGRLTRDQCAEMTATANRSLNTLQERLTALLKLSIAADQPAAVHRQLERIELVRCTLVSITPRE